jgi:hypothetical protein
MRIPLIAALALLTACGLSPAPGDPVTAELSRTELRIGLDTGATCRIPRAAAARDDARGWGGPVTGCAGITAVDVAFAPRPAPPLGILPALIAALSLDGVFAQYAQVRLTGADGRIFDFESPPPPGDWD